MSLKNFVRNPGSYFFRKEVSRKAYKGLCATLFLPVLAKRRRLAKKLPAPPIDVAIPEHIGFRMFDPASANSAFPTLEPLLRRLKVELARANEQQPPAEGKSYLRRISLETELWEIPEVRDFVMDDKLLSVVASYLGDLPILAAVKIFHSVPTTKQEGSQLYHSDHDDTKQVKVFVHLKDVTPDSGPLTLIPATESGAIRKRLGYEYGGKEGHIPDEAVFGDLKTRSENEIVGPVGSTILVDTSRCFHFGSRVQTADRLVFHVQFVTSTSFLFNPLTAYVPGAVSNRLLIPPYARQASPHGDPIRQGLLSF